MVIFKCLSLKALSTFQDHEGGGVGLQMMYSLRVIDALELKFTPLKFCPVRGIDPLNWLVRGVFSL